MDRTQNQRELTLRGLVLGAALTLVFTAANVFLGLTRRPDLRHLDPGRRDLDGGAQGVPLQLGILENNIVQTVASAAGTLSSIIFVLPGLVMVGWWADFPFWQSFADLRVRRHARRDVLDPPAPRAGHRIGPALPGRLRRRRGAQGRRRAEARRRGRRRRRAKAGLAIVLLGSVVSAVLRAARRDAAHRRGGRGVVPHRPDAATGVGGGLSFALVGVGHLVGLSVGMAMLLGAGARLRRRDARCSTVLHHSVGRRAGSPRSDVWKHEVRFIGAGVIGVAAMWTLRQARHADRARPRRRRRLRRGARRAGAAARCRSRSATCRSRSSARSRRR